MLFYSKRKPILLKNDDIEYFREGAIVHGGNDDRGSWYLCEVQKSLLKHSPGGSIVQGRSTMFIKTKLAYNLLKHITWDKTVVLADTATQVCNDIQGLIKNGLITPHEERGPLLAFTIYEFRSSDVSASVLTSISVCLVIFMLSNMISSSLALFCFVRAIFIGLIWERTRSEEIFTLYSAVAVRLLLRLRLEKMALEKSRGKNLTRGALRVERQAQIIPLLTSKSVQVLKMAW